MSVPTVCDDCGNAYRAVWYAPNEMWNRVMGGEGGMLCSDCFDARCEVYGDPIIFRAFKVGDSVDFEQARAGSAGLREGLERVLRQAEHVRRHWDLATRYEVLDAVIEPLRELVEGGESGT